MPRNKPVEVITSSQERLIVADTRGEPAKRIEIKTVMQPLSVSQQLVNGKWVDCFEARTGTEHICLVDSGSDCNVLPRYL
jgi:hypothetical protein